MRFFLVIIAFLSAFFATPWITALLAVPLAIRWRSWEVVLLGFLVDVLWFPSGFLWGIPVATLVAIAFVWILEPFRNQLLVDQPLL